MNSKLLSAIGLLVAGLCSNIAHADVIDPAFKQVEDKMAAEMKSSCTVIVQRLRCWDAIRHKYEELGVVRGTPEYIDKNYGALSAKDMNAQIIALNKFYGQTRGSPSDRKHGELTDNMMSIEVSELHHLIDLKGGARALQ